MTPEDLRELRRRLDALRAMTVERGCSEAEALVAAERYAALLTRHGLSEADLDAIEMDELRLPARASRGPLDALWATIGRYAGCAPYFLSAGGRQTAIVYFGRPADLMVAEYVHDIVDRALQAARRLFRKTPEHTRRRLPKTRAQAIRAWEWGFASRVVEQLQAARSRRQRAEHGAEAHAVEQRHEEALKVALRRRNVNLRTSKSRLQPPSARYGAAEAAGDRAGGGVTVREAVASGATPVAGLLR